MRFYGFGNYYLSSLQQGLQAGHTIAELFVKHNHFDVHPAMGKPVSESIDAYENLAKADMVLEWASDHKTMVLLNGGNSADLAELYTFFNTAENPFPFAKFHEDEQSLNGALTYVGIILPARIYDLSAKMRALPAEGQTFEELLVLEKCTSFENELIYKLNQFGLAR
jgi:hypothetical protein